MCKEKGIRTGIEVKSDAPSIAEIEQIKRVAENIGEVKNKLNELVNFCITDYEQNGNDKMLVASKKLYETIKLLEVSNE